MADTGIVVDGADELDRTLRALADGLEDMSPAHEAAGQLLQERADAHDRASEVDATGTETTVTYDEVYSPVVYQRDAWLAAVAADTTDDLAEVYVDHVDDLLHRVRGA